MSSRKDLNIKLTQLQSQPGEQGPREYWQCLEELSGTDAFQQLMRQEFPALADIWPDALSRRKFLGLMGASLGLAGLGCSAKPAPQQKIVPYVRPPEELIPGIPLFFATTMVHGGDAVGLLVESHEGRPTKVEGNPDHPASLGATSIFHQASVLTMYDPARSQTVVRANRIRGWDDANAAMAAVMSQEQQRKGAGLRLLTETVLSPTLHGQITRLLEQYPEAKWHQYEPINDAYTFRASQQAFGKPLVPLYDFSRADVVLSLDADFLNSGPGHLRYTREFMKRRRVRTSAGDADSATMNRLYVAEPEVSCTGAKADHRLAVRMQEIESLARALAAQLDVPGVENVLTAHDNWIAAAAKDLKEHAGKCLVLAGHRQSPTVHLLVHAINAQLGNVGATLQYVPPTAMNPIDPVQSMRELVEEMEAGKVQSLFILGGNPVYTAPADLDFSSVLQKVPQSFHLSLYEDETSRLCGWHLPQSHYLEAWSDARCFDGTSAICQPLIEPLYQGRSIHEVVDLLNGRRDALGRQIVQSYWRSRWEEWGSEGSFDEFWETALHDGVIPQTRFTPESIELQSDWQSQLDRLKSPANSAPGSLELIFQADPTIYDGSFANNGWLQELPKPITKLTWGNAAILSPRTAERLELAYGSYAHGGEHGGYEVPVLYLSVGDRQVEAPVWIMPGHADDCVTVYLGHGRTHASRVRGEWQQTLGFNAYTLRTTDRFWLTTNAQAAKLNKLYPLACTQAHHVMDGREIIHSATLSQYRQDPEQVVEHHEVNESDASKQAHPHATLYKPFNYDPPQRKWGMVVDTTTCIGCNACVVACQAENNIPVVGKDQVLFGREMHWLRVDRYISGPPAEPKEFHFQPVPCMHCEQAPCEYVCPVAATVHSADGLNEMIYNRCVGTRFCSNNCPYKVRRFNFLSYGDFDTQPLRLQYNPDVTVRSRGVMEKCTYCVQRIRQAEINAESAQRPIRDGEVLTACQAVCPAEAIVFGDLNDPKSTVKQWKDSPLNYGLLAELNTKPRTTYLGSLRNPNPELAEASHD